MTITWGRNGKHTAPNAVEIIFPSFNDHSKGKLTRTNTLSITVGKKGLELQRLLLGLASIQGRLALWSSTKGGRAVRCWRGSRLRHLGETSPP